MQDLSFTPSASITPDAAALCQRIVALIEAGRIGAARPLLAAVKAMTPDGAPEIVLLSAQIAVCEGDCDGALRQLSAAIARSPAEPRLRKCRADAHQRAGNAQAAARDAAEAVVLDRGDAEAKALLGSALLTLGCTRDAVACLNEAVNAKPDAVAWREALATALEASGDPGIAQNVLAEGVARNPAIVTLRNAAMLIRIRQRDFAGAVAIAEEARKLGIADACTFGMRGHALASLGDHEAANAAYQDAYKLGPNDPYVRHLVMASGMLPSATRAPPEYLAAVFDGYAERFEPHLISLGYTVPVSIRERLLRHPAIVAGQPLGPALDLGCGTGLVALSLSDLPIGPLTGVDLSGRMLDIARSKRLYADLRQGDILTELATQPTNSWSLIVAADVLIYFGALDSVFTAVRAQLAPGGWFVFSVEELTNSDTPWQLHRHGRFAHHRDYVLQALQVAGLRVLSADAIAVRHEAGMPVPGLLVVAERPRDDS